MLTILVVGQEPPPPSGRPDSAIEVMHARDAEDAVEKLGRNRRIDAVLVLPPAGAAETLAAIREDNPSPPPVFLPAGTPPIAGARTLPAGSGDLVEAVARALA